ncbi:NACHT domain-containing protein [Catenulispora sp. GAS73]|uniref:NACHT domain-containing protein n=1 Tax=Catenulispora sp. GAS73 TaxID=3156269 RepID=UPI0035132647
MRAAADILAHNVRDRWIREEEHRRVHDPRPLPVRWHAVRRGLVDDGAETHAGHQRADRPITPPPSGTLTDIAQTYRSVATGRLVVLGRAGSGKTVLALRFVVDYLDTREADEAVPVIFSLGAWNPATVTLRDWLAHRLLRDHPELGAAAPAPSTSTLAATLLAAGWILPVLDGFDEIDESLQGLALNQFNATTLPFLLTSRSTQFEEAVAATRALNRAAGIELDDLTVADLADYLPGTAPLGEESAERGAAWTVWQPVLTAIDEQPEKRECARLVEVLRTPLMVLLARTIYSDVPGRDPADLLEEGRFRNVEGLERHLLAGFVPALYQDSRKPLAAAGSVRADGRPRRPGRSWSADEAGRYAGHIAAHLGRSQNRAGQDLAWWRLGDSVRPMWRVLAVTLAGMVLTSVAHLLLVIPVDLLSTRPYSMEPAAFLDDTFLIGPVVGLSFGLVYALLVLSGRFTIEPSRVQVRLSWRRRRAASPSGRIQFVTWAAFGFLGGTALGCGYGAAQTFAILLLGLEGNSTAGDIISITLTNMAVYSLIFGLAASLSFGLMATLTVPDDVSAAPTPLSLLAANRAATLRQLLVLIPLLALAIGLGGTAVTAVLQGPLGPLNWPSQVAFVIGTSGGFIGVGMYTLTFTAWGQWLLLARFWLPLTGRLPWATAEFLEDAYSRGLLRQSGAVYQFRHARLQAQLEAAPNDAEDPRSLASQPVRETAV